MRGFPGAAQSTEVWGELARSLTPAADETGQGPTGEFPRACTGPWERRHSWHHPGALPGMHLQPATRPLPYFHKHRTQRFSPRSLSNGSPRLCLWDHALGALKPIKACPMLTWLPACQNYEAQAVYTGDPPMQGQSFKTGSASPFT